MSGSISRKNAELYSLLAILIGSLFLAFLLVQPYLNALLGAIVVAIAFEPIYRRFIKLVGRKESLAALLTVLVVTVVIIGPLIFIGQQIFYEGRTLYLQLENRSSGSVFEEVETLLADRFGTVFNISPEAVDQFIKNTLRSSSDQIAGLFSGFLQLILKIAIGIFAIYYFLKEGVAIKEYFIQVSPLGEERTRSIVENLHLTIQSTIRGSIVVALVQAILLAIGFVLFSVPNPFLWGSVGFIAALVPALGTTLVTLPVAIYLVFQGSSFQIVGFLIWGVGIVGVADNILRPYLMGRHTGLHPFLVFLSVIGGIGLFGPLGILWGPIILSLLAITLESYAGVINDSQD